MKNNRQRIKFFKRAVSVFTFAALLFTLAFGGYRTGNVEAAGKKSIVLNKKSVTLTVGQTTVIKVKKVKGLKSKAVIYKSSNSKIASINKNGKVKAKKAGKATIVVISIQDKKVKAKVTIRVKAKAKKKQQNYNKYLTEKAVRKQLEIPSDAEIRIYYGEPYYWEAANINLVAVRVAGFGKYSGYYAGGNFTEKGKYARNYIPWEKQSPIWPFDGTGSC